MPPMDWSLVLLRAALLCYALGVLATFIPILGGRRGLLRSAPWLAGAGAAVQLAGMVALGFELGRCPLGTLPEVLSALGFAATAIYLGAFWRWRLEVLHVIIQPLVLVLLVVSWLLPAPLVPVAPVLAPVLLRFHLTVIVLAVAGLFLTFAASVVYLIVDRGLKTKRPPLRPSLLPSLERCDRMGRVSLLWAFGLLTLGIVTGAAVSAWQTGSPWAWQPREVLAILAWMILGLVVVARLGWGWRGRNPAVLTIVGFGALLLRMLGVY
jgi:ABC-type uncharacterized transport system permease subunit